MISDIVSPIFTFKYCILNDIASFMSRLTHNLKSQNVQGYNQNLQSIHIKLKIE
jgi:hypothetical protein